MTHGNMNFDCPIEPSHDRVVLKEDSPEEITAGGIIIPDVGLEKTKTSRVLAIGPQAQWAKPGDHVVHTKFSGVEIEIARERYLICPEVELLGRLATTSLPEEVFAVTVA
jgi:chaperonin GroES